LAELDVADALEAVSGLSGELFRTTMEKIARLAAAAFRKRK